MKTNNNIIVLMIGFLTPVVLISALAASVFFRNNFDDKTKPSQTITVENVSITEDMYAAPKACFYEKAEIEETEETGEETEETKITFKAAKVCFRDDLLIRFVRR